MKTRIPILVLLCLTTGMFAQNANGLIAQYLFNTGTIQNDLGGIPPKAAGTSMTTDRFGNENSACFIYGKSDSYLNLGTSSLLKPTQGTISIWIKISERCWSGTGYKVNPIILAKSQEGDDFFEAYSIVYSLESRKFNSCTSLPVDHQVSVLAKDTASLDHWYHLAITYDNHFHCLYVDGVLQDKVAKNFQTVFLATDSVMVGYTANGKNNRFFLGAIDDIRIYNKVLTPDEIENLYTERDPVWWHVVVKWVGICLVAGLLVILGIALLMRKLKRELELEKEKNKQQSLMYEMEMRVIKAQMNPHFIFNSMNAIQQFILMNDNENANNYLVTFSKLIRKILESNSDEYISLDNEIEILTKYLEMESLRFQHSFQFEIIRDEKLSGASFLIPQMLVQPIVENAIWHGLLPKQDTKKITISFLYVDPKTMCCSVEDNGIGRAASQKNTSRISKKSLGIQFTQHRLELIGKALEGDYGIHIDDLLHADQTSAGTRVRITIPLQVKKD